jgi:hypothetical protein
MARQQRLVEDDLERDAGGQRRRSTPPRSTRSRTSKSSCPSAHRHEDRAAAVHAPVLLGVSQATSADVAERLDARRRRPRCRAPPDNSRVLAISMLKRRVPTSRRRPATALWLASASSTVHRDAICAAYRGRSRRDCCSIAQVSAFAAPTPSSASDALASLQHAGRIGEQRRCSTATLVVSTF